MCVIGGFSIEQAITTNQNATSKSIRCPCCDYVRAKFNGGGSFGKLRSRFYQFISLMASKNKRKQTFKEEYSRSWDFIKPSRKGENHARCTLCSADFSIAASGKCITMLVIKIRVIKWGKGSLFVYVFKKYRFLLKNTGLWASKYRFVFPEVGMSAPPNHHPPPPKKSAKDRSILLIRNRRHL